MILNSIDEFNDGLFNTEKDGNGIYKGFMRLEGPTEVINYVLSKILSGELKLYRNQYMLIKDTSLNDERETRYDGCGLVPLTLPESSIIKAKNALQRCALDLLLQRKIHCCAILGGVGSGKTYLCTQMAHHFVLDKKEQDVIVNVREPWGEGKSVGFLKGSFDDKTCKFFMPIEQQLKGQGQYDYLKAKGIIRTEIPYYMKGTTYDRTLLVVDEAEDLSESQIKLIGTRVGMKSRIFFCGDFKQSLVDKTKNNSLVRMCNELKGNHDFGCVYLEDDVRSPTSKMFASLFE